MSDLITTSAASRLIEGLRQGSVELTSITGSGQFPEGTGTMIWEGGEYRVRYNVPQTAEAIEAFKTVWERSSKPAQYTLSDRWRIRAVTRRNVVLEFYCFPPSDATASGLGPESFMLATDSIKLLHHFDGEGQIEGEKITHHAVFHGVTSPFSIAGGTTTESINPFLGPEDGFNRDTWLWQSEGKTFAIISRAGNLHAYIRFQNQDSAQVALEEQREHFASFLDAVTFTHGLHGFPILEECSADGHWVSCEIGSLDKINATAAAPISSRLMSEHDGAEDMLPVMYRFIQTKPRIALKCLKLHRLLCQAHDGKELRHSDALALCSIFEGTVNALFENLAGTARGEEKLFNQAGEEITNILQTQLESRNDEDKRTWSRFLKVIGSAKYATPREKLQALAKAYGIPWEGDAGAVFKMWQDVRNPIAHGSSREKSESEVKKLFDAWWLLTGFINRLILTEVGYVGPFIYSRGGKAPMVMDIVQPRLEGEVSP